MPLRIRYRLMGEGVPSGPGMNNVLRETGSPVRYYLPAEDVRLDLLTPSDTHTYCPFKGTASYWSLPDAPDLVWSYPEPKPAVAEIKDHLCFYEVDVS